jgi:hypothetical protein
VLLSFLPNFQSKKNVLSRELRAFALELQADNLFPKIITDNTGLRVDFRSFVQSLKNKRRRKLSGKTQLTETVFYVRRFPQIDDK